MTSKLIAGGVFFVAVAIMPGLAGAHCADAHHNKTHHKGEACDQHGAKKKSAQHQATKAKKRSSWDVVQKDPCLAKKYKRFAANNKDEKARRRYVDQLAHDGCAQKRDHHVVRHDGHGEPSHAERTRHYDDDGGASHTDRARHYDDDRPAHAERQYDDDHGRYSARHWKTYDEDAQPAARRSATDDDDNEPEVRSPLLDLFR